VKFDVKEDQTGSRLANTEKEGVERSKERGNGGRVIGGPSERDETGGGGEGGLDREDGSAGGRTWVRSRRGMS